MSTVGSTDRASLNERSATQKFVFFKFWEFPKIKIKGFYIVTLYGALYSEGARALSASSNTVTFPAVTHPAHHAIPPKNEKKKIIHTTYLKNQDTRARHA